MHHACAKRVTSSCHRFRSATFRRRFTSDQPCEPGYRITRPPELIAEVVSPSTRRRDEQTKFELYRQEGVTWYLLPDPSTAKATAYRLIEGDYRKVRDFHEGEHAVELTACTIRLDCSRLWERP
jgi:Uma2 family endonuclease